MKSNKSTKGHQAPSKARKAGVPSTPKLPGKSRPQRGLRRLQITNKLALPTGSFAPSNGSFCDSTSGVSIAHGVIRNVVDARGPIAWYHGRYYGYEIGSFRPIAPEIIHGWVLALDGIACGAKGKPLAVGQNNAKDVMGCMRGILAPASAPLFDDAPVGLAFKNVFAGVKKDQLVELPHTPANRARHWVDAVYSAAAPCPKFERFLREFLTPNVKPRSLGELFTAIGEAMAAIRVVLALPSRI